VANVDSRFGNKYDLPDELNVRTRYAPGFWANLASWFSSLLVRGLLHSTPWTILEGRDCMKKKSSVGSWRNGRATRCAWIWCTIASMLVSFWPGSISQVSAAPALFA